MKTVSKRRISWRRLALVLSLLSMPFGPMWVTGWQDDQANLIRRLASDACYQQYAGVATNRPNCFEVGWQERTKFIEGRADEYHRDMLILAPLPAVLFWLCFLILWGLYRAVSVRAVPATRGN